MGNRVSESTAGLSRQYTLDPASNRILSSLSTQSGDTGRQYQYDALGNRIGESAGTQTRSYRYNPFNRLSQVTVNGAMTNYVLNALDQRIRKENTTGRTDFSYDEQGQLAFEQSQSGHSTNYLWFAGQLVGIVRDGKVYDIATDHLGRPEVAWDRNNAVVWRATNHAFDREVAQDSIGGLNIGFPGQYYDQETGFWYNGHRDYDPMTDRYLQPDPLGLGGGINPYVYASGNPLMKIDPLGLWCFDFDKFAQEVEKNRLKNEYTLAALLSEFGFGTMPKSASEMRSLGLSRDKINPWTGQLSRWNGRISDYRNQSGQRPFGNFRALRDLGRSPIGLSAGTAALGGLIFEGFYDLGSIGKAAWDATSIN